MAVNSKQKGARFERLLASKFREYGYDQARRTAQYCGNTGAASDVVGLPGLHIEAKHIIFITIRIEVYKHSLPIMDIGQILNHTRHWDVKEVTRRFYRLLNIFWSQAKLLESLTHLQKLIHRSVIE